MHIISSLILFFPIFIVGLMYLLSKKEKLSYNVALGISIVQIIISLILNFFTFIFILINEGMSYEDNPYKYQHIYNISDYKEYTYQFPKEISSELIKNNNVQFYYSPQFLQGGFNIELLMVMKNEEMDSYILQYESQVKEIINVNSENISELYSKYGIYKPYSVFKDKDCDEFYDIFIRE